MPSVLVRVVLACALFACDDKVGPFAESAGAPSVSPATVRGAALGGKQPLRVAYSDWPGWTAFEIGIQKGWFKEAGLDVAFSWFDYQPSLDAFTLGKVDAVTVTNADALVLGANGSRAKMIVLTDYSDGNDKIIARPGIASFKELKGKEVGLEFTLIEHLLFLRACQQNGLKASDVQLVNFATVETPGALTSGQVAAIAAWYPVSGQALRAASGAKAVFSSADAPGLIYDTVAVTPASLAERRDEWVKFAKVWYRISDYVRDPRTQGEAAALMASRAGVPADEYLAAISGTYFLTADESKRRYEKGAGLESLYGSTSIANDFNVSYRVYKDAQPVDDYVEPSVVLSL